MNKHSDVARRNQPLLATFVIALVLALSVFSTQAQVPDSFDPNLNNPFGNNAVEALVFEPNGRVLVGGTFTNISAQPRYYVGRVNPDGALDLSFNLTPNSYVRSIVRQPDGKTLLAGNFTNVAGVRYDGMLRLQANGSIDPTFTASANGLCMGLALQDDGKIVVGGNFTTLNGQGRVAIGRLNANGSLDTTFNAGIQNTGTGLTWVSFCALQPDGKILIVGQFQSVGGLARTNFARLNTNGTVDTTFIPLSTGTIESAALQANNQILVGGLFNSICGQPWTNLARLNANGTLDSSFNPHPNGMVSVLVPQADGKILVAGAFGTLSDQTRTRIGRLNQDGTVDSTFISAVSDTPSVLGLRRDGKIVVGGPFVTLGAVGRNRLGRLSNTDPATESFTVEDTTITWLRGGTGPEVNSTDFATSSDGTNWVSVGKGQRIDGGWQLTGSGYSTNPYVRARGVVTSETSTWYIESILGSLKIITSPISQTNNAGTQVSFSAEAVGDDPVSYQWFKLDAALTNGGKVFGATTPTLVVTNVFGADAGDYFLVASNLTGSVTSEVATLTVIDPLIVVQPASKATNAGQTVTFNVQAVGTPLLSYQWRRDGVPLTGGTLATLTITNVQNVDIASYDVLVGNAYGSVTSAVATLTFLSTPDSLNASVGYEVYATALQRDGKILIGGAFGTVAGQPRGAIARLNVDGSLDSSFAPNGNNYIFSIIVQPDDKILVAGWITSIAGSSRTYVARLNANGNLDSTFNANVSGGTVTPGVYSMALRPNGKILIAGDFSSVGGQARTKIAQLNADGTLDLSFNPSADNIVYPMIVQTDGKVVIGGNFTNLCGVSRQHIGRLNLDGTLDTTFDPGNNNLPLALALQTDGKILVGGSFSAMGGQPRTNIARLNPDGSIDPNFTVRASSLVRSIALQADGKIILGGNFASLGNQTTSLLGRLLPDGTPDPTLGWSFANPAVYSVTIQTDGKFLVGGSFLGTRPYFLRLTATWSPTEILTRAESTARWVPGGTAPQSDFVSLDVATGTNWVTVPTATAQWTNGGWELGNVPTNALLRINSSALGGRYGCSRSSLSSIFGPLEIWAQPFSRTNALATTASFSVTAVGTGPLIYQWYKEGLIVTNSSSISGATSSSLVLSNLVGGRGGDYSVVVSNSSGSITSSIAKLTLVDPILTLQPMSRTNNAGSNQTFSVTASGTAPLTYRWFKDGTGLTNGGTVSGAQGATLTITNVLHIDNGDYACVVSNISGAITSSVANLTVIDPYIWTQPVNQTTNEGASTVLNVVAAGSGLTYQWRKNSLDLSGGTTALLSFTNAQWTDRGSYNVVVSGSYGNLTSSVAILNVISPYPATFVSDGQLGFSSNQFGFALRGNAGQVIVVDGSSNLIDWTPLCTNTFGFESFYFNDPDSTNESGRFYRARVP